MVVFVVLIGAVHECVEVEIVVNVFVVADDEIRLQKFSLSENSVLKTAYLLVLV